VEVALENPFFLKIVVSAMLGAANEAIRKGQIVAEPTITQCKTSLQTSMLSSGHRPPLSTIRHPSFSSNRTIAAAPSHTSSIRGRRRSLAAAAIIPAAANAELLNAHTTLRPMTEKQTMREKKKGLSQPTNFCTQRHTTRLQTPLDSNQRV
jgi:hypothetical protein